MATRPKRMSRKMSRPTKRSVDDYSEVGDANVVKVQKRTHIDKNLSEVETVDVDKERKRVKIHFTESSEKLDEWRDYDVDGNKYLPFERLEKPFLPGEESMEDRRNVFHNNLYRAIKRKLWSGRRDDPQVKIELNTEPDVFASGLGQVTKSTLKRGKEIFCLNNNRMLDGVLGLKWDERIMNCAGDFAYVVNDTVRYWMTKKTSIQEYKYIGEKYVKCEIEDTYIVVFTFVRGDGNKRQYLERS